MAAQGALDTFRALEERALFVLVPRLGKLLTDVLDSLCMETEIFGSAPTSFFMP